MNETARSMPGAAKPDGDRAGQESTLADRYRRQEGEVFLSGNQALVRLPLQQRARDSRAGLNTAGFISGYRGSPLGRLDMELWQAGEFLKAAKVHFQPGVNEDLAATAVWGAQQSANFPGARFSGVFGIWYGKGPGVDRSGDALKHANAAGTAPLGGVLALAGDDHGAKSSTQAHQSEQALIAAGIPILYPSNVQEILDYGLHGIAMSRHAGCWVAMKLVTDVVEGSSSVTVGPDSPRIALPPAASPDVHIKRIAMPKTQEEALYGLRLPAALDYARLNGLNEIRVAAPSAAVGIVSAGKSYGDTRQALEKLAAEGHPVSQIRLLKIGLVWPLDPGIVRAFARGLRTILVIEEKRPLLEDQIKTILFDSAARPTVIGKFTADGVWSASRGAEAFSLVGELNPDIIAARIGRILGMEPPASSSRGVPSANSVVERMPTFCSGCPHSTSTRLPEDSLALAGIGCHSIALLRDPMQTGPIAHMGAEGAMWVGMAPFTDMPHMFANIGDGTYYHSGFLAIRQAVAAKVSITYKLLLNGFVSMTGGQPIEGELTPAQISGELLAEGVGKIAIVTDDPGKFAAQALPAGVDVHHRDRLDFVQKELRAQRGVTVLIYDQMCATERRRQRKRGKFAESEKRSFINAAVCEGCGDCSDKSSCLSIEPLETEYGRKRRINQTSCNTDLSCVRGFCPSFVTIVGGRVRRQATTDLQMPDVSMLPEPALPSLDRALGLLVTGIGGTGVITLGAIIAMAAHLDGVQASTLDLTGLAQKYGAVMSHVRLAPDKAQLHTYRLAQGEADVVIGCDLVVAAGTEAIDKMDRSRTRAILGAEVSPTRDFTRDPDWHVDGDALVDRVAGAAQYARAIRAGDLARALVGDPIGANMLLLGYAWQNGWLPLSRTSIERAIRLNGAAVQLNLASFAWGRLAAHDPVRLPIVPHAEAGDATTAPGHDVLASLVERRCADLTGYQNPAYAARYRGLVARVAERERRLGLGEDLAVAVARGYYKLLAYKDEFEVARLYSTPAFRHELAQTFEGSYRLRFHLGAGPFARREDADSEPRKTEVGAWIMPVFRVLSALRFLRGTVLDPFAGSSERQLALRAIVQYEADIERLLGGLSKERHALAVEIASLPDTLRGYGHVRERSARAVETKRSALWLRWDPVEQKQPVGREA
jgi:indolepyruvate ferredoxin oxidoreductase